MTRITKLEPEDWDEGLRALTQPDTATPLEQGLMRMFAHTPGIARGLAAFGGSLKMHRTLPRRLVELVRLRVAFHNQCRSCMAIRYTDAVNAGVTEDLVCELADPPSAENLTDAEQSALGFADRFATDHLAIDDAAFDGLREHFTEPEIMELAMNVAFFVGFGRLAATLDMTEELPEAFQAPEGAVLTPWGEESIAVR
ncbi:MAG: carboxymuconolactone decarboxylase family protein [Gammaproteobacteria bacterium]|nr:carboxymuconolactone decarboxylase family protein [Gammaproteobacteria bacterium]MDE0368008.1 carboxymuconolactone decarboxylase family protein [Gammaproteobacteria bacterium]